MVTLVQLQLTQAKPGPAKASPFIMHITLLMAAIWSPNTKGDAPPSPLGVVLHPVALPLKIIESLIQHLSLTSGLQGISTPVSRERQPGTQGLPA